MSIIHIDSLATFATTNNASARTDIVNFGYAEGGNDILHRTSPGMFGRPFIEIDAYNPSLSPGYIRRTLLTATNLWGISFKFAVMNSSNQRFPILRFNRSSGNAHYIGVATAGSSGNQSISGAVSLWDGISTNLGNFFGSAPSGSTVVGAADPGAGGTLTSIVWMCFDLLFSTSGADTLATMRFTNVNGQQTGSVTISGSVNTTSIDIGNISDTSWGSEYGRAVLADLVIYTNNGSGLTALPPTPLSMTVQSLRPSSNGSLNNWTPTPSGTNWDNVNDMPLVNGTVSQAQALSSKQTFFFPSLGTGINDIKSNVLGIQYNTRSFDTGTNTTALAPIIKQSATEYSLGSNITPSRASQTMIQRVVVTNPATSAAFTPAEISALELGYNTV